MQETKGMSHALLHYFSYVFRKGKRVCVEYCHGRKRVYIMASSEQHLKNIPTSLMIDELKRRGVLVFCDCGAIFQCDDPGLYVHLGLHSCNQTYKCFVCQHVYGNYLQLQIHASHEHGPVPVADAVFPE